MVNQETGEIVCTFHGKGKEHDFRIFKNSKLQLRENIKLLGDKGYQGIQKFHTNSQTPKKKPRKNNLSICDQKSNRELLRRLLKIVPAVNQDPRHQQISSNTRLALSLFARLIATTRVVAEHINCKLKVFKILSDRYRNRRASLWFEV